MNKKLLFVVIAVNVILALTLVFSGKATEERSLEQRVTELEQRVAFLEACLKNVCTSPEGLTTFREISLPNVVTTVTVTETVTPIPTETVIPTVPPNPTTTPEPTVTVSPTEPPTAMPEHCNQGLGNGPEGCDPGNSNHNQPSNDEGDCNRGGKCKK